MIAGRKPTAQSATHRLAAWERRMTATVEATPTARPARSFGFHAAGLAIRGKRGGSASSARARPPSTNLLAAERYATVTDLVAGLGASPSPGDHPTQQLHGQVGLRR